MEPHYCFDTQPPNDERSCGRTERCGEWKDQSVCPTKTGCGPITTVSKDYRCPAGREAKAVNCIDSVGAF